MITTDNEPSDLYLTNHELTLLYSELKLLNLTRPRDALLIELTLNTGLRESELVALTKSDIQAASESIYIRTRKGGKNRNIPIYDRALFLRLISFSKTCSDKLFDINESRVRQIWYEVRPQQINKSFHKLRHTYGIYLKKQGFDIWQIAYSMGHKSISSTQIYTQETYTPDKLRGVMYGSTRR